MHNRKRIILTLLLFYILSICVICCPSSEMITEITYLDENIQVKCNITDVHYNKEKDSTYVFANLVIRNIRSDKHIVLNLDNLFLCLSSDKSIHIKPAHPNLSIIEDKLYTSYDLEKENIYWDFDDSISISQIETAGLYYKYHDDKMTERLMW